MHAGKRMCLSQLKKSPEAPYKYCEFLVSSDTTSCFRSIFSGEE